MGESMFITRHAMRRYMERIRPGADDREALLVLKDAAMRAKRIDERTFRGQALWSVDEPDMRLVTKHDRRSGMVCVTVLHPSEPWEPEDDAGFTPSLVESPPGAPALTSKKSARRVEANRRRQRDEAGRQRNIALGLGSHNQRRALRPPSAPTCGIAVVQCYNLLGDHVSVWRRSHDGAGLCATCDAQMDQDVRELREGSIGHRR